LRVAARKRRRVDRNERGRERALSEEVLQQVGNAECGVEGIGRIGRLAEVVREYTLADESGEPAAQDPERDERGAATAGSWPRGSTRLGV
jgi:hypothetical protein